MPSIEDQPFKFSDSASSLSNSSDASWWGLIGTIIIFLLILAAALWMIRRLNRSTVRGLDAPWVKVLDRQVLGGQQNLYLVEIAGKLQVLGGSDHHLIKISEIEDPEIAAEILEEIANTPSEKMEGLLAKMGKIFGQHQKKKEPFPAELKRLLEEVEND